MSLQSLAARAARFNHIVLYCAEQQHTVEVLDSIFPTISGITKNSERSRLEVTKCILGATNKRYVELRKYVHI